jgi:hypothetical protein
MCGNRKKLYICAVVSAYVRKGLSEWQAILKLSEEIPIETIFEALTINENNLNIY